MGILRTLISWLNAQFIFLNSGHNSVAKISYLFDNKTLFLNYWLGVVDRWPIDFRGLGCHLRLFSPKLNKDIDQIIESCSFFTGIWLSKQFC